MIKVSFILPCYNVEPYIGRCLNSLFAQDMPLDEYEIICVNDCSPDNLRDVVIQYQQRYPNIRLIEHSENKTSGGARNTGIEAARGEYLWFVDPDDIIVENCVNGFYQIASKSEADILVFNSCNSNGVLDGYKVKTVDSCEDGFCFVRTMFPEKRLAGITSVCKAFFKRSFCVDGNIRFPEIKSSQDVVFLWECIINAKKIISIEQTGYIILSRPNSMTGIVGKFKADAIFSCTIFYANALLMILDKYSSSIPLIFKNDILREVKLSLDDNSRNILQSSMMNKKIFYEYILSNRVLIDRLYVYMNNNTQNIFNYKYNIICWFFFVECFRVKRYFKHIIKHRFVV